MARHWTKNKNKKGRKRKSLIYQIDYTERNLIIYEIDQVPLSVIVAWIMGIEMDLDFSLLETGSLAFSIIVTAFALQVINLIINFHNVFIMLIN
jgi:hypothetical protein